MSTWSSALPIHLNASPQYETFCSFTVATHWLVQCHLLLINCHHLLKIRNENSKFGLTLTNVTGELWRPQGLHCDGKDGWIPLCHRHQNGEISFPVSSVMKGWNIDDNICFHLFSLLGSGRRDPEEGSSSSFHKGNIPQDPTCTRSKILRLCQTKMIQGWCWCAEINLCVFTGHLSADAAALGPWRHLGRWKVNFLVRAFPVKVSYESLSCGQLVSHSFNELQGRWFPMYYNCRWQSQK